MEQIARVLEGAIDAGRSRSRLERLGEWFTAEYTAGNGYVWVLGVRGYLWKIDPITNTSTITPIRVGDGRSTRANAVVTGFGSVWATSADGFLWRMTP
jgi:DNA-binding beta-propeller fold protein YncE